MAGIKELSEALIGIDEIAIVIAGALKDGPQFSDFETFYMQFTQNADFRAKVQAAWEGRDQILPEAKDLDFIEIGSLIMLEVGYIPKIIEALKK